jgi:hypothetical protein
VRKWIALALSVLIGAVMFKLGQLVGRGSLPPSAGLLVSLVFFVVYCLAVFMWWRGIDEMAREAHKQAWFWGGSIGLTLAVLPITFGWWGLRGRPMEGLADLSPNDILFGGVVVGFLAATAFSLLGYLIAWLIFWMRNR